MSYLAPVRNSHKGERKAKLDDIRRIGHLLTYFRKISLFSVALNMDPKSALNLKTCTGLVLSWEGLNYLFSIGAFINTRPPYGHF